MVGNGGRWVQLALMVPMAILGSPVSLRKPPTGATVCLDYAPASNVNPVITTACVPGQASQQLGFDPRTGYIHEEGVSPAPSCREGSDNHPQPCNCPHPLVCSLAAPLLLDNRLWVDSTSGVCEDTFGLPVCDSFMFLS